MLTLFAGRLVQIQGMEAGYYREVAKKQTFEAIPLPAMRGTIYGADGQVLAMTVETYTVTADPPQIADKPHAAQELAGPLGLTQQQVLNLLEHPTSKDYVVLAKGVSAPNQTKIAALNIPGVASSPAYVRDYPDGDATANVVGFTNVNPATGVIAGQTGLEQEYNKLLSGTPGSEQVEIGADGQPIPLAGSKDTPAQNGTGIRLTIIPALQLAAQQACEAEVNKTDARQCTVVIIQPKTGAILAMAQWPTYDQNTLTNVADAKNLAGAGHLRARLHRQGHDGRRGVRARRPDADEPLLHPVRDLPGRPVDPRRGVPTAASTTRSRASSRTPATSACPRWSSTSRRRCSTTTCALSASASRPG